MFKESDVVILSKRGLLGREVVDYTNTLSKNEVYTISNIRVDGFVLLRNVGLGWTHPDHFTKVEDEIYGNKIFSRGDKVLLESQDKIGWETQNVKLIYGQVYTVTDYSIDSRDVIYVVIGNCCYHPNHFKKA